MAGKKLRKAQDELSLQAHGVPADQHCIARSVECVSVPEMAFFGGMEETADKRRPKLPDIESLRKDLVPLVWTLQMAMRDELTLTMLSNWGRRRWVALRRRTAAKQPADAKSPQI